MVEVHVMYPDLNEAAAIARAAVEKRLAACANIGSPMRSFYWWEGKVQSEPEVMVIFKTADARLDQLIALVAEQHSYDVPAITVHRPVRAETSYEEWVNREASG